MNTGPGEPEHQAGATPGRIAARFVAARLGAEPLSAFPGEIPSGLDAAYRCQDAAIELWPDSVGGWKVGRVPPDLEARFASDRLAGPIFASSLQHCESGALVELPVYAGGFAAIEAEFVVVVGADAPADKLKWSLEEARALMSDLRIGLELASSPLATINELGPAVVVADFGNNAGLVVGPSIRDWPQRSLESMACETFVAGHSAGRGGAFNLSGGPLRSLQFMLELAARRGRPLRTGMCIATGQTTGIHDILPGQEGCVDFGADGSIRCRAFAARPLATRA